MALFSGAMLTGRKAYLVPLVAMFASDVLIGYPFDLASPVVYASLAAGVWLGAQISILPFCQCAMALRVSIV